MSMSRSYSHRDRGQIKPSLAPSLRDRFDELHGVYHLDNDAKHVRACMAQGGFVAAALIGGKLVHLGPDGKIVRGEPGRRKRSRRKSA